MSVSVPDKSMAGGHTKSTTIKGAAARMNAKTATSFDRPADVQMIAAVVAMMNVPMRGHSSRRFNAEPQWWCAGTEILGVRRNNQEIMPWKPCGRPAIVTDVWQGSRQTT